MDAVRKIVECDKRKTPFHDNRPGETWYRSFMRRHPEIAIREPENVTAVRACVTEGATRTWFQKARDSLFSHEGSAFQQIMADPRRIFNTDETSFSLCPKSGKILGPKGRRNVDDLKRGNEKDTLTELATFSADGSGCGDDRLSVPPRPEGGRRVRPAAVGTRHRTREHSKTSGFIPRRA